MKIGQSFGEWLPQDRSVVTEWVNKLITDIKEEEKPGMNLKNAAVKTASPKMGYKEMVTFKHQEVLEFKHWVMLIYRKIRRVNPRFRIWIHCLS